jgi:hypothetical protein
MEILAKLWIAPLKMLCAGMFPLVSDCGSQRSNDGHEEWILHDGDPFHRSKHLHLCTNESDSTRRQRHNV